MGKNYTTAGKETRGISLAPALICGLMPSLLGIYAYSQSDLTLFAYASSLIATMALFVASVLGYLGVFPYFFAAIYVAKSQASAFMGRQSAGNSRFSDLICAIIATACLYYILSNYIGTLTAPYMAAETNLVFDSGLMCLLWVAFPMVMKLSEIAPIGTAAENKSNLHIVMLKNSLSLILFLFVIYLAVIQDQHRNWFESNHTPLIQTFAPGSEEYTQAHMELSSMLAAQDFQQEDLHYWLLNAAPEVVQSAPEPGSEQLSVNGMHGVFKLICDIEWKGDQAFVVRAHPRGVRDIPASISMGVNWQQRDLSNALSLRACGYHVQRLTAK